METFTGVILDVSGSMANNIGDGINEEGGPWASSIFKVIDDLIKHDVSESSKVFTVGVGAESKTGIIDIIGTIKKVSESASKPATHTTIQRILRLLERNGARTVRKWAESDVISEAVSEQFVTHVLKTLESDEEFRNKFVYECLPEACRNWNDSFVSSAVQGLYSSVVSSFVRASVQDIKDVAEKAKRYLHTPALEFVEFGYNSIFSAKEASDVLHGVDDGQEMTAQRSRELLKKIEPYIYGGTPLHRSINEATKLFNLAPHTHHKLLFILSDGEPADTKIDISNAMAKLKDANVKVVGCFISSKSTIKPRTLFSKMDMNWDAGAKFLFGISSTVPTELVTRAIFIKRGWDIEVDNNETRLFLHANHPENIKDACDLARNVVCCQDALSELLVSVDLDIYINDKNKSIKVYDQGQDGTCYAHASASVLHLAMHRILGRNAPDFESLRDEMVSRYGKKGARTFDVLRQICPKYHLRCRQVDENGAMKAIVAKRPVVARFWLTKDEWRTFDEFYLRNPDGIIKKSHLDISRRPRTAPTIGHAVVLTSYNSECLRLMNSYGDEWGDNGFFKVEKAEVLGLDFIDVYWTIADLTQEEISYYESYGSEVAAKMMRSLKGLQVATFACPSCKQSSLVTEYRGTLSRAKCPLCRHEFSSVDGEGNILALNIYLTSLSRLSTVTEQQDG